MRKKSNVRILKRQVLAAEQLAADKEALLTTILKTLPDMIWLKNVTGVYLACNPMFERLFGTAEANIVGKTDHDFLSRSVAEFFLEHDRRAMAAGKPTVNEEEVTLASDGRHLKLETIKTPMFDAAGALVGVLGIARDITERKRMETALGRNAEMHGVLREIAEAAILAPTLAELFQTVHRLVTKILPAELFHINLVDEAAGEVRMPFWADDLDFIPHQRPIGRGLTEYVLQQGRTVYLTPAELDRLRESLEYFLPQMPSVPIRHYLASPLIDFQNRIFGTIVLMLQGDDRDFQPEEVKIFSVIAAQVSIAINSKQAEEAMRESERRFANAFLYASTGMALILPSGRCLKTNQAFCQLLGYTAEELTRLCVFDLIHPADAVESAERRRQLIVGEIDSYQAEKRYFSKSGDLVWGWVSVSLVRDNVGATLYFIAQVEDISRRKQLEGQLRRHADELERTVEHRTQDLYAANQELTAMNERLTMLNDRMGTVNAMLEETNQQLAAEIGARREKEKALAFMENQYRTASTLLISSAASTEEQLREAVTDALRLVKAPVGYIGIYDGETNAFNTHCAVGAELAFAHGAFSAVQGAVGEAFSQGEVLYIQDYRNYVHRLMDEALTSVSSLVLIPLKKAGRVVAGLAILWLDEPHRMRDEEIEVLRQYGNLVSLALERKENQLRIEQKNRLLQGLAETTATLLGELDLDAALQEILAKAIDLADIPHGFVLLVDEKDPHKVFFRAGQGRYTEKVGKCEMWHGGAFEELLRTGRVVVIPDYRRWPLCNPESVQNGVTMSIHAPLIVDGRIIGDIGLTAFGETVAMSPEKINILEQFANVASIAVKNARYHEKIRNLAYRDTLTGLPNRAGLSAYLESEMERTRQGKAVGAVLFIDLDDLKTVNDHFGHTCGDSVIVAAGEDIVRASGQNAFVSRIGGDEFVVVLPDADNPQLISRVADRLVGALRREYEVRGQRIHMSTSIGITLYPEDGDAAEEVLKNADIAMYAAKAAGKNCWRIYEHGMQRDAYEKMVLTQSLRHALERHELYLQYQPLVSLTKRAIVGFEALLRWDSKEHGQVEPARFIPLAEQSGMISFIGEWVLNEASQFARQLADSGHGEVRVAVNVSPRQLTEDRFVDMVRRAVDAVGINSEQLEIEITENVLIESLADSTRKLAELSKLGVGLSLDDFGTGYSSLTYLRSLPVKTLKIDKSFIDGMLDDKVQEGFIRSMIDMAHVLSLHVVAEGVETEQQLGKLTQLGCDCVQGYIFSRPVARETAVQFFSAAGKKFSFPGAGGILA